jgi:hypothetical protein
MRSISVRILPFAYEKRNFRYKKKLMEQHRSRKLVKKTDRRVEIEGVTNSNLSLKFFFSWDRDRYGVSASVGRLNLEEKFLPAALPGPELPDKRICEAYWGAFVEYANGDNYYAPVFGARPDPEAKSWGRSEMTRMRYTYDAFAAKPGLS